MSLLSNPEIAEKLQRIEENTRWRRELKANGIDSDGFQEMTLSSGARIWMTKGVFEEMEAQDKAYAKAQSYRFHMLNFATNGTT